MCDHECAYTTDIEDRRYKIINTNLEAPLNIVGLMSRCCVYEIEHGTILRVYIPGNRDIIHAIFEYIIGSMSCMAIEVRELKGF